MDRTFYPTSQRTHVQQVQDSIAALAELSGKRVLLVDESEGQVSGEAAKRALLRYASTDLTEAARRALRALDALGGPTEHFEAYAAAVDALKAAKKLEAGW